MKNNIFTKALNAIAKINIWIVTAIGLAAAIWLIIGWEGMPMVQRINVALIIAICIHEWEENHIPGGFMDVMIDRIWGLPQMRPLIPQTRVIVTCGIILIAVLPAFFPNLGWWCIAPLYLGVFEGFIHIAGIFMAKLGKPYSPGMITALLCLTPVGGYGLWYWASSGLATPLDWTLAVLIFLGVFGFMYGGMLSLIGMPFKQFVRQMRSNIVKLHSKK